MKFHSRRDIRSGTQRRALSRIAKLQPRVGVITNPANVRTHQRGEEGIDELQYPFTATEIGSERNAPTTLSVTPLFFVVSENARIGETKPIDALLHIADQKAVALAATTRANDRVLRRVDVLAFIDEHMLELPLPGSRRFRGLTACIDEQLQCKLFEIRKVHDALRALRLREFFRELPRKQQQRAHRFAHPVPIVSQRIAAIA